MKYISLVTDILYVLLYRAGLLQSFSRRKSRRREVNLTSVLNLQHSVRSQQHRGTYEKRKVYYLTVLIHRSYWLVSQSYICWLCRSNTSSSTTSGILLWWMYIQMYFITVLSLSIWLWVQENLFFFTDKIIHSGSIKGHVSFTYLPDLITYTCIFLTGRNSFTNWFFLILQTLVFWSLP